VTIEVSLQKRLGGFTLDVAFEAPAGITAIFGASGSGKTQTLRCIAGLVRPDSGRVAVQRRVLFDSQAKISLPTRDRRVGYVFQHYALFPHLDVAGNIAYGLQFMPAKAKADRVGELLELVGLPGFGRRSPRELSGGQQQRVALARALAPSPDVLLLDEPFSAVDALVRAQLRRELRRVQEHTKLPMLLVSHDLTEVLDLAEFIVIYDDGRVLQAGAAAAVLARPANPQVAELLTAASGATLSRTGTRGETMLRGRE
jgi:molybdenum ABC transporter ATP-binding protein